MGGSKPAENQVIETELSSEQADILRSREQFLQDFTLPELRDHIERSKNIQGELSEDFLETPQDRQTSQDVSGIRNQFDLAENQLTINLNRRGLEGSGIEARSLSQLNAAEASQVGGRVAQNSLQTVLQQNSITRQINQNNLAAQGVRGSALQSALQIAPTPTSAAPVNFTTTPGEEGALGATLSGAATGATTGFLVGGPYGAIAGGVIGAGAGYASAT
jgi:hypothetical protein